MCQFLEKLIGVKVTCNEDFTRDERNLISVGYKNLIGDAQASIRVLSAVN